jgi:hypothetical protein
MWHVKSDGMPPTAREVLQREVAKRAEWIINDCRTFFRVRHDKLKWYQESIASSLPLGGGNFLMLMGQLNVIGLLAKVYLHLACPDEFATDADVRAVKEAKKEIVEKLPLLKIVVKENRTQWRPPRPYECNEEKAFRKLTVAMAEKVDLGIIGSSATDVWKQLRNNLTHMAWPEGSVAVCQFPFNSRDAEIEIDKLGPPFRYLEDRRIWQCNVDRLNLMIPRVVAWLLEEIRACPNDDRVEAALRWMRIDIPASDGDVTGHSLGSGFQSY